MPAGLPRVALVHAVHLADILAREQRIGYSGNHVIAESSADVARQLGLTVETVAEAGRRLGEELTERSSLLGLETGSEAQVYFEALTAANRELGQLNAHLQAQALSLGRRSAYFGLLSDLAARLNERQNTAEICALLACLWREHNHAGACAAYAIAPDAQVCEGGVCKPNQPEPTLFLIEPPDDTESSEQGWGETFAATHAAWSHGWFFEEVDADFDIERTWVMPLRRGRQTLGALLWESDAQEGRYADELPEMEAFASGATLAILQAQRQEQLKHLSEDLVEANRRLRDTQRELLQKRSLAAVGEMACGAAHEINNPLAVIVGRAQFLAGTEEDEKRRQTLEKIAVNGQEVSDIITELLEFAQPAVPKPQRQELAAIVRSAVDAARDAADQAGVRIELKLPPESGDVNIDGQQVAVALTEVLWNAIEASREKGRLVEVNARRSDFDGAFVVLEIKDYGCGMDQETLRKALDPFFSARPAGRGRGLGLSRASRYLEVNGGRLELLSQPDQGATVRILLPAEALPEPRTQSPPG
jgi:signal transduction histidine kinase